MAGSRDTITRPAWLCISMVNVSAVRLEVNGLDVTPSATRTDSFVTYSPSVPLGNGSVSVRVSVADNAGNVATRSWTFTVRAH